MPGAITVTGFLGAGKSALAARLRAALPGREIVEAHGCAAEPPPGAAVAVADSANLAACLGDALIGPLVAAQLRAAGLVALTRTDLVPAGPALVALAGVTDAPAIEVPPGDLPPGLADRIAELPPRPQASATTPCVPFAEWRYSGPIELPEGTLSKLLADRPDGLYRLTGTVRCGGHGIEVQVVGRLRQTRPVTLPDETTLVAIGPKARFRPDRMAVAVSEAAAARGWLVGLFGHR